MKEHTDLQQVFIKEGATHPSSVTNFSHVHLITKQDLGDSNLKLNILKLKKKGIFLFNFSKSFLLV